MLLPSGANSTHNSWSTIDAWAAPSSNVTRNILRRFSNPDLMRPISESSGSASGSDADIAGGDVDAEEAAKARGSVSNAGFAAAPEFADDVTGVEALLTSALTRRLTGGDAIRLFDCDKGLPVRTDSSSAPSRSIKFASGSSRRISISFTSPTSN